MNPFEIIRDTVEKAATALREALVYDVRHEDAPATKRTIVETLLLLEVGLFRAGEAQEPIPAPAPAGLRRFVLVVESNHYDRAGNYVSFPPVEVVVIDGAYMTGKINAIKRLRESESLGLKEANDVVDSLPRIRVGAAPVYPPKPADPSADVPF